MATTHEPGQATIWRRKHPDWGKVQSARKLAKQHGAEGELTVDEWVQVCAQYGNKCLACGETERLTIDHIVPLSKGGRNDVSNIQPLCWWCNTTKNAKIIDLRQIPENERAALWALVVNPKGCNNPPKRERVGWRFNFRRNTNNKSGYIGVHWHKKNMKWRAQIAGGHKYKRESLGMFSDPKDAARAYNKRAIELYGESAILNVIDE